MSAVFDAARVTIVIADYAVFGPDGKLSAIGAGWHVTALVPTPAGLALPAHYVAALVQVPQSHAGEQVALTLTLRDSSGEPLRAPAQEGAEAQQIRIGHLAVLEKPQVQGVFLPPTVPCRVGIAMGIPLGLAVPVGETYRWTLHIDDDSKPEWSAEFYVVSPPTPPVFG